MTLPHLSFEPEATAWFLLVLGLLLAVSALFSRVSARAGVPLFLVFLVLGMLAGSEGIGGIEFEDYGFAFRLGTAALVLILFDGGLNTPLAALRAGLRPAAVLATVGVIGTASLVAVGARLLGFDWGPAFLLGAMVSSTDAAAVFSVLRGSGLQIRQRVGTTLELESGLNDPMAVILTLSLTGSLAAGRTPGLEILLEVLLQLGVGAAFGLGAGFAGRALLRRSRLQAGGLYPVLSLAVALLAFGLPTLLAGSGFLAVYLAGVILGNGEIPYRTGLRHFHDTAAWCGQLTMFLVLGLLVFPSRLLEVAGVGLAIALVLAFVARPLVVMLCLLPFRFPFRETAFVSWVGLRGAVPISSPPSPCWSGSPGRSGCSTWSSSWWWRAPWCRAAPWHGWPAAWASRRACRRRPRRSWRSAPPRCSTATCSPSTSTTPCRSAASRWPTSPCPKKRR